MSACLGGEVAQTLQKQGVAEVENIAREYEDIFSKGNYFLDLMPTLNPEQKELNEALIRMSGRLDIPLVATNDCHYVDKADAAAHEVLMAIQTGKSLNDERRLKHTVDSYYLKTPSEMNADFSSVP